MATSHSKSARAFKCESCGGDKWQVLKFQGEEYAQCITPRVRPERGDRMVRDETPCKFWSTKARAADYVR